MKRTRRFLITLALLLTAAVQGALAEEDILLTTITPDGSGNPVYSVANIATLDKGGAEYYSSYGWFSSSYSPCYLTVTAAEGITITKVKFTTDDNDYWEDTNAPFEVKLEAYTVQALDGAGVTKIEVYGNAIPAPDPSAIDVTWNYASKTGTLTMPAGNVVLTPVYAPVAKFAVESEVEQTPAAADGTIYAGSTTPLVTAGTVASIGSTENKQGTVMYYAAQSATDTPPTAPDYATEGWSEDLPTAESFAAGTVYVWYYIKGADAPTGQDPTADNTFSDSDISATALQVALLSDKFDIIFKPANTNTIESGKATVTVGGTAATVTDGKLTGVKMGSEVKIKAKSGYIIEKVEAKKAVAYTMAAKATAEDKGKLICTDGHIHADGEDADCTKARVAMIVYLGTTGDATYSHGLALALVDEGKMNWATAKTRCEGKNESTSTPVTDATWLLASQDQWNYMVNAAGSYTALRDGFSGITGASNLQSDWYWSSTEKDSANAWFYYFEDGNSGWYDTAKSSINIYVRACLAF